MRKKIYFIESSISGGKSTLLNGLSQYGYNVLDEPLDRWQNEYVDSDGQNILDKFYKDMSRWSFDFQIFVMNTRFMKLQEALANDSEIVILERSLWSDRNTFAKSLYESGKMSELQWKIYKENHNIFMLAIDYLFENVDINFVHLHTKAEECLRRLKTRGRTEEEGLPLEYLQDLERKHLEWFEEITNYTTHVIDGNQTQEQVLKDLIAIVRST